MPVIIDFGMTITIDISKDLESRLKLKARTDGKDLAGFVKEMVEREAKEPTWNELVAPYHEQTRKLGFTESELDEIIDTELAAVRRERTLLAE